MAANHSCIADLQLRNLGASDPTAAYGCRSRIKVGFGEELSVAGPGRFLPMAIEYHCHVAVRFAILIHGSRLQFLCRLGMAPSAVAVALGTAVMALRIRC